MSVSDSEIVVVLAPKGRDTEIAIQILREAGLAAKGSASLGSLVDEFFEDAGLAIIADEAIQNADLKPLGDALAQQPPWSDFPIILLTQRGGGPERNPAAIRYLALLGNVTFLERPFHPATLVSLVQSALRARRRQYAARMRMNSLRESEVALRFLDRLADLVQPLQNPHDVMAATAKHLGEHLNVAVCAYADMDSDQDGFTIRGNWTTTTANSIVGHYQAERFRHHGRTRVARGQAAHYPRHTF